MHIYLSEILILVAWFCGPAIVLALATETWFFRKHHFFGKRAVLVVVGYAATVVVVPILSVALVALGVGRSPVETLHSGFNFPWFWQSFVAATIVAGSVLAWTRVRMKEMR